MAEMSDAEVFGSGELSDADVFGGEAPSVDDGLANRFVGNTLEAARSSPIGIAARYPAAPKPADASLMGAEMGMDMAPVPDEAQAQYQQKHDIAKKERIAQLMTFDEIPNWYDSPTGQEGFLDHVSKLAASGAGQLIGGAVDPTNLLPVGRGKTVLRTILKGAAPMGAYNAALEYASQTADLEAGVIKNYDWETIAAAAGSGAVLGGGANALAHHGKLFKKGDQSLDPDVDKLKTRVDRDVDMSDIQNPYFTGARKQLEMSDDDIWHAVDQSGDQAHSQMDLEQNRPIEPWWPDQDLQKAIGKADKQADKAGTWELPYDGPGKGEDVDASNIRSPYMSKYEVETANQAGEPAAWEHVPPEHTRLPDDRELGSLLGRRVQEHPDSVVPLEQAPDSGMGKNAFGGGDDLWKNAKYTNQIHQAKSAGDAIRTVGKFTKDKAYQELAKQLARHVDDVEFIVPDSVYSKAGKQLQDDIHGVSFTTFTGDRWVAVKSLQRALVQNAKHGLDAETILHEGGHAATAGALFIGDHPQLRKNPKYREHVKFRDAVQDLFEQAQKAIGEARSEETNYAMQDTHEFTTMAWSNKTFQDAIGNVIAQDTNVSILTKFVNAVRDLFGLKRGSKEETILDRMLGLKDRLPYIQNIDKADLGESVKFATNQSPEAPLQKMALKGEMKHPTDVDPDWTASEAWAENNGKDLSKAVPQNLVTPNQIFAMSKNKMFGWFMAKVEQIYRQSAPRFADYHDKLKPFMFDKGKLDRDQQINTFKALVDLQEPTSKHLRAAAEKSNTREALLESSGLQGREIDFAIAVLDIMKDVHTKDIQSARRLGRELEYQPMYFPRIHGGRFVVKVKDVNGREQYVKGFDSYAEARADEARLRNQLKDRDDLKVDNTERSDRTNFSDDLTIMLLEHQIPAEFFEKTSKAFTKSRETAPFAFEKSRRDESVSGYVGENLNSKAEQERLLEVMAWRLMASRNFETKSRLLNEVKFPLYDTGVLANLPVLAKTMGYFLNRELGVDISAMRGSDRFLQGGLEIAAKALEGVHHFEEKYIRGKRDFDFRWEDPAIAHDAARNLVRQWAYWTSMMKLGLNIPVLATNFTQNSLVGLDGIRTAKLEGVNSGYAMTAFMDLFNPMTHLEKNSPAAKFLAEAEREGMFKPHAHEHYTTAEMPLGAEPGLGKAIQYPRDKIEQFTNYVSILYYYNFFSKARPDLKGEALKAKVFHYARSFTGQYESFATPLMFDKTGVVGQGFTNFSKWHFNQLGRLMTDVRSMGAERTAVPLLTTAMMSVFAAGVYGLPVVVEYEALRRLFSELGWFDMPPVAAIRGAVKDTIPAWEHLERGAITAAGDELAKMLGARSGPDVSASMRHAAFFDTPTVAIQNFVDIFFRTLPWAVREGTNMITGEGGNTPEQFEKAARGIPPALKELWKYTQDNGYPGAPRDRKLFKEKMTVNGKTVYAVKDPSDQGRVLYRLDEVEDMYNMFGMRSAREIKQLEAIYYEKWLERHDAKELATARGQIMANLDDKELFKENIKRIVELTGTKAGDAVQETLNQIKSRTTASQFDFFTAETMRALRNKDSSKLERIKRARKLEGS